ncbi:AI-2E family transporter [Lentilactobacillus sp. SPB1-3]|uniref:AI-2E family transporter n=1 Tax=Lentilactobacillus terminaliae TaxID=3003483 RepID=A0ACD5DGZ3_9LACO|nr:AI-2E family transporter [Lentilactobacillus sp. SPB1-3]MCZ0977667.1 AI-2E family transporter [Lentilactobacillus sp. SPB1-3]
MHMYKRFIENVPLRRIVVLLAAIAILVVLRSMMNIILLTFIFSLLVTKLTKFVQKYVKLPSALIVTIVFLIVVVGLFSAITKYVPQLAVQTVRSTSDVINFYSNPKNLPDDQTLGWINQLIQQSHILSSVKNGVGLIWHSITAVTTMGVTLFLSLMLSFFFSIEEKQMVQFSQSFKNSYVSWLFEDLEYFGRKFVATFGVVIEAQFFIALVNTAITTVVMIVMGLPQVAVLALMVFILSLIPVAGVIISLIPLSLVGYSVGGFTDIIYLIVTIIIVHALEAYVLNPKFMSSRTNLPIFYTFVVLLIGENFFGVWGLICGVPVFTFFLDILGVQYHHGFRRDRKLLE